MNTQQQSRIAARYGDGYTIQGIADELGLPYVEVHDALWESNHPSVMAIIGRRMIRNGPSRHWTATSGRPLDDWPLVVGNVFGC